MGRSHHLLLRHHRRNALREADAVVLAGVPYDFRLDYGRQIRPDAALLTINLSRRELTLNRRADLGIVADPGEVLLRLAVIDSKRVSKPAESGAWLERLKARDAEREAEIDREAGAPAETSTPWRSVAPSTAPWMTTAW